MLVHSDTGIYGLKDFFENDFFGTKNALLKNLQSMLHAIPQVTNHALAKRGEKANIALRKIDTNLLFTFIQTLILSGFQLQICTSFILN